MAAFLSVVAYKSQNANVKVNVTVQTIFKHMCVSIDVHSILWMILGCILYTLDGMPISNDFQLTFMRESSREATRSCKSFTRARMVNNFLLASPSFLLASARAARLGATTCHVANNYFPE